MKEPLTTNGNILVEIAAAVDQTIFRAIAKIAFNYVAHQHGPEFVLHRDFDDIRNYIRFGTVPSWAAWIPVVKPDDKPILFDDTRRSRQTNGHLVTFDWNPRAKGFVARVSLFNSVTYQIAIRPEYSGLWRPDLRTGHHFDIEDKSIESLFSCAAVTR
ncbi:MAG: hypothetical protein ACRD51_02305 [Candidatus Acidiferrum sp.]